MTSLSVNKSDFSPFAFTLRKTKIPISYEDYTKKLIKLIDLGLYVHENVFEHTSGLHMHGVLLVPKNFNFKLLRTRGWRLQLDEIYDLNGWLAYLAKERLIKIEEEEDEFNYPEEILKIPKRSLFV